MLAERQFQDRDRLMEEALSFIRSALEDDPYNSYILSFAAQVHYLVSRSYVATYEFAERSVELNPANPIGWSLLGTAKCYLGDLAGGLQDSDFAVRIGGGVPYRYHLLGQGCIANTLAHNTNHAKRLGELSHIVAPHYAPPLRYLAVLHFHDGDEAASWEMVSKLRVSEPDFSFATLKDESYPSAGLARSGLLDRLPD